ncbi:MAG TPA: efflux RND transporter periplasmic adaptor subunit [Candidatus Acidoferrum sp.]|nr:efflux RND transporter periplasmic adaptor subunit [Candidatus Acidoferrum sp.]
MSEEFHNASPERAQGQQARSKSRLFLTLLLVALVLVVLGGITLLQRRSQFNALAKETETLSIPTVSVTHPTVEQSQEDLTLPGTMQAYVETPIYARTNGYLKKWYFDIGSRVAKGALLAEIDTPEVDQQLSQARADLNTAKANTALSETTAARYTGLLASDSVSKQEVDNTTGDLAAKRATQNSAEANVRRLEDLESFKNIYAPFSGVITRRNVDIGNLINAGNGGTSQQLFYLSQIDPIRVYVSVPELYAPSIHTGLGAYLVLAQFPGRRFEGRVVRTANAIDQASRTLLTEVDVPNKTGELLPGGYSEVHLEVKISGARLQVPVNALLFRAEGLRAVSIDADHKTHLKPLQIGRDYGTYLEVLQGLDPNDWIVVNPADSLDEGQQVNVKELPQASKGPVPAGAAPPPAPPAPAGNAGAPGGNKSQNGSTPKK